MAIENRRHFFVYGEVSRAIQAASSSDAYTQSLRLCKNAIVRPEGGVTNRLGTQLILANETLDAQADYFGLTNRAQLLPLPSRVLSDTFMVAPNFENLVPDPAKADLYDFITVDTKPNASGFGVDTVYANINDLLVTDLPTIITNNSTVALPSAAFFDGAKLKYTTNGGKLQVGFATNFYLEFTADYALGPDPRVFGAFPEFQHLRSFDPLKYPVSGGIQFPTRSLAQRVGATTGGQPLAVVVTLYNNVTNEEIIMDTGYATNAPPSYSATEYYFFEVTSAIPADHVVRVYIAPGKEMRNARLLGVIRVNGTAGRLIYIGQPLDTGVTVPMHRNVLTNSLAAFASTVATRNRYYLVTHTLADYPYSLDPTTPGLEFSAKAEAAAWEGERLVLAGFGVNALRDFPNTRLGTNRVAFSNLITSEFPRVSMALPGQDTSSELPFSINVSGVNEVYHLIAHKRLLAFTDSGVFTITGDNEGAINKSTIRVSESNKYVVDPAVVPVVAGNEVYFALTQTAALMRAQFEREINGYSFFEASFTSKDLFARGAGFNTLSYTREHYNTLWITHRTTQGQPSNIVTALTLRDGDNRLGAHQHDFGAVILDTLVLEGKGRDARLYMLTERTRRDGTKKIFIERLMNREIQNNVRDVEPRFQRRFYDCFTEGIAPRFAGSIVVPTSGTEQGNVFTVGAVGHGLTLTPGARLRIQQGNVSWDAEIVTSTTNSADVFSAEDCPFSGTLTGAELIQLANALTFGPEYWGFNVGLMTDGIEVANTNPGSGLPAIVLPNTVTGPLVLSRWFDHWILGFNYVSEVQSVSYVPPENVPNVDVQKRLHSIDVEFEHTKDLLISGYEPEDVTPSQMDRVKQWTSDFEADYYTGRFNIPVRGEANRHARVLFRQVRAAPFTILGYEASVDM